jgi:hypothetical protein
MVKNWADHDSSDEEGDLTPEEQVQIPLVLPTDNLNRQHHEQDGDNHHGDNHAHDGQGHSGVGGGEHLEPPPPRTYDFPKDPPFTAYVGNLAYNMTEANELGDALTDLAKERLGLDIHVVDARIMMDRQNGNNSNPGDKPRHRGFGYVEVETLDMLTRLMELNADGNTMLCGRKIQVDTANQAGGGGGGHGGGGGRGGGRDHRGGGRDRDRGNRNTFGPPDGTGADGTTFRGGRFNNQGPGGRGGGGGGPGGPDGGASGPSRGPPGERPKLKLQSRSKPKEDGAGDASGKTGAASIFGDAKPRDEQSWTDRKKVDPSVEKKREPRGASGGGRGEGGRGGRGGEGRGGRGDGGGRGGEGRGGRGDGAGRGRSGGRGSHKEHTKEHTAKEHKKEHTKEHKKDNKDSKDDWHRGAKKPVDEKKKTAAAPAPIPEPVKPTEKVVVNRFAGLDMDSDSE